MDFQSVGWPQTDSLVSDSRDILSTTRAYDLFSKGSSYCTILVAVSALDYTDKDTKLPAEAGYGIYWTPGESEEPFRVYHCSKTTRWLAENGSEALPVCVRMDMKKVSGKDAFDPTFFEVTPEVEGFLWEQVIPPVWRTIIQKEKRSYP